MFCVEAEISQLVSCLLVRILTAKLSDTLVLFHCAFFILAADDDKLAYSCSTDCIDVFRESVQDKSQVVTDGHH